MLNPDCFNRCIQDGVVKNGYALIVHNTSYAGEEPGSHISGAVVSQFFDQSGFKTELFCKCTAEVMSYFYLTAVNMSHSRTLL